jgi:hypothetical protein
VTLGEFAALLRVAPRWVQNAAVRLGRPVRYTLEEARRLTLARAIHGAAGTPLPAAYALARRALSAGLPVLRVPSADAADGLVHVVIEMDRFLASFAVELARVRNTYAPKLRGALPRHTSPTTFGVDLGSLRENLRRSPAERLASLQAAVDFFAEVRRAS